MEKAFIHRRIVNLRHLLDNLNRPACIQHIELCLPYQLKFFFHALYTCLLFHLLDLSHLLIHFGCSALRHLRGSNHISLEYTHEYAPCVSKLPDRNMNATTQENTTTPQEGH
jgi:hypothetical protein